MKKNIKESTIELKAGQKVYDSNGKAYLSEKGDKVTAKVSLIKESRLVENNDIKEIVKGFLQAALFTGVDFNDEPLDQNFTVRDFSLQSVKKAEKIVEYFMDQMQYLNYQEIVDENRKELDDLGIDLWMTMTGQDVSFHDWDEYGDALYDDAKTTQKKYWVEACMETGDGEVEIV